MTEIESHERTPNRLIDETSPYLLQHAYNPVDWHPWGEEAFEKARVEDKPIFLSVGYSACHWCHVMEHESFESDTIAQLLNENYISIKVDREERPDVDQIYMSAVQLITKRGGWPMSVFMTADGKPFYGGTYWPPTSRMGMPGFQDILLKLTDYWQNKREEVVTSADQLVEAIQGMAAPVFDSAQLNAETLQSAMKSIIAVADMKHGGLGGAPKFPHPMDLRALLRLGKRFDSQEAIDVVSLTLKKMLHGGIYDQIGGGFHRYSTDAHWLVPHFEKMLYDNALLVPAYLEAWQFTGENEFHRAVVETLDYVLEEMTSEDGAFYSTQDADSEGVEGKFFVWKQAELVEALGEERARIFNAVYDVSQSGNWEGQNILNRPKSLEQVATELEVSLEEIEETIASAKKELYSLRKQRIAPGRDEKILVSWNGMMIAAMAQAAFALDDAKYLNAARNAANFVLSKIHDADGNLVHSYKDGRARFQAYLDDYACFIEGLLELFQASGEEQWLEQAVKYSEKMIETFWDEEHGGFYYTANDHESLIARTKDYQDNAVPSGNGVATTVLAKLGRLCERSELETLAVRTIDSFSGLIQEHPRACGQGLIAVDFLLGPSREIVVIQGENSQASEEMLTHLRRTFLPNGLIAISQETNPGELTRSLFEGKDPVTSRVYLCERGTCHVPAESVEQLKTQLCALESEE